MFPWSSSCWIPLVGCRPAGLDLPRVACPFELSGLAEGPWIIARVLRAPPAGHRALLKPRCPKPFSTLRLDRARRRRGHSTYRSTYREAEGSVTIGANFD